MYSEILRYMGHTGSLCQSGASEQMNVLISSCLEKLAAVCTPRYATLRLTCTVSGDCVTLGVCRALPNHIEKMRKNTVFEHFLLCKLPKEPINQRILRFLTAKFFKSDRLLGVPGGGNTALNIKSAALAASLYNCTQACIFAATLGAAVDRLIAQRVKVDSAEALCLQACAAAQIEELCGKIEQELSHNVSTDGLYLRPRFSPGYGDFDIAYQTDILRMLQAHKQIGITETKAHMLTPLKSVTAVIGLAACPPDRLNQEQTNQASASGKCDECNKTDCRFKAGRG